MGVYCNACTARWGCFFTTLENDMIDAGFVKHMRCYESSDSTTNDDDSEGSIVGKIQALIVTKMSVHTADKASGRVKRDSILTKAHREK